MKASIVKALMATAMASVFSVPAYADFNCEVYITQEAGAIRAPNVGTLKVYSQDVPHFRTSGSAKFKKNSYAQWLEFVPLLGPIIIEVQFPTRAQKCMKQAMEQTFSSDDATSQIFDLILSGQADINAKTKFCTAGKSMAVGAGGHMENGFTFKFKARKVTNRSDWLFRELDVHPPKSYCSRFYEPSCFGEVPNDADTAEPWGGESLMDSTDDLWNDNDSSGAVDSPADVTLPDAPPPPPPTEYCEPKPFTLLTPRKFSTSVGGTEAWSTGNSSGTYNSINKFVLADFSGEGFSDYFDTAIIRSFVPSTEFKESCVARQPNRPRRGFGMLNTGPAFNNVISCLPTTDRGGDSKRFKLFNVDNQPTKLMKIEGGNWSTYETVTETWSNQFPHGTTALTYDPRAFIPSSVATIPANLSQYKQRLRDAAGRSDNLAFGDFFGDGHDDAFVVYDNKWWVSNDLTGPWIILADLNNLTNVPVELELAEKAVKIIGGQTEVDVKEKPFLKKNAEIDTRNKEMAPISPRQLYSLKDSHDLTKGKNKSGLKLKSGIQASSLGDAIRKSFGNSVLSTRNLHIADFTGDGIDDVFVTFEDAWYIFESGGGRYKRLRPSTNTITSVKFGDFNGDGQMDVYEKSGNQIRYYASGKGQAQNLQTSQNDLAEIHTIDHKIYSKSGLFTANEE